MGATATGSATRAARSATAATTATAGGRRRRATRAGRGTTATGIATVTRATRSALGGTRMCVPPSLSCGLFRFRVLTLRPSTLPSTSRGRASPAAPTRPPAARSRRPCPPVAAGLASATRRRTWPRRATRRPRAPASRQHPTRRAATARRREAEASGSERRRRLGRGSSCLTGPTRRLPAGAAPSRAAWASRPSPHRPRCRHPRLAPPPLLLSRRPHPSPGRRCRPRPSPRPSPKSGAPAVRPRAPPTPLLHERVLTLPPALRCAQNATTCRPTLGRELASTGPRSTARSTSTSATAAAAGAEEGGR